MLVNVSFLAFTPLAFAFTRYSEHEADRFGLEITHQNRAAATAFVKLQQENLQIPQPGLLYTPWRSTQPSLAEPH